MILVITATKAQFDTYRASRPLAEASELRHCPDVHRIMGVARDVPVVVYGPYAWSRGAIGAVSYARERGMQITYKDHSPRKG